MKPRTTTDYRSIDFLPTTREFGVVMPANKNRRISTGVSAVHVIASELTE